MNEIPGRQLNLASLQDVYAVCQLRSQKSVPDWVFQGDFYSITRTPEELSIICPQEYVPEDITCQPGWRVLKVEGPFNFNEIGVLASLTGPLAAAQLSLLTISTYDTDYLFIQGENFEQAVKVLSAAGHQIN